VVELVEVLLVEQVVMEVQVVEEMEKVVLLQVEQETHPQQVQHKELMVEQVE
tara:strand:+ start:238 stop:393 length:156 start_codon:yes stop_codon:yes gene_type:complete